MSRVPLPVLVAVGFLTLLATGRAAVAQPADALPTFDEVQALYDKGEYNETLKQLSRLLALKGKAAEGMDRYGLLMLRAESHLRLKANSGATAALAEAAKVAPDDEAAAKARALAILVKRSKNLQYTPKVSAGGKAGSGPIDITDVERRPDAFAALYTGERAAMKPKLTAADKAKNLPPIAAAMKAAASLRDLELAATGKDDDTADALDHLVKRAHKLMAKGLDEAAKRTEAISERANQLVEYTYRTNGGGTETRTRRRGLGNGESRELKDILETCRKVHASCDDLVKGFAQEDDADQFADLKEQAEDVGLRARDVMTENYDDAR
jgi:hypothetical protein